MTTFNKALSIRFKKAQVELIRQAAADRGMCPNTFIRWAVDRVMAEKGPDLMKKLTEMEATLNVTYLTLHELTKDLYVRIPPPPEEVKLLAEKDGAESMRRNVAQVAAVMNGKSACKK